jgi:hypothetical protein
LKSRPASSSLLIVLSEVAALQHLPHVRAEAADVVAQIGRELRRVGAELVEVVARGVVEGEA